MRVDVRGWDIRNYRTGTFRLWPRFRNCTALLYKGRDLFWLNRYVSWRKIR